MFHHFYWFRRNCYLEDEKVLKFFKIYTKNNCENECLTNFMISRCGCVEFFMIRNSSTRICSARERNCFNKVEENFEKQKRPCECFEPCEYVKYDFETITSGAPEWVLVERGKNFWRKKTWIIFFLFCISPFQNTLVDFTGNQLMFSLFVKIGISDNIILPVCVTNDHQTFIDEHITFVGKGFYETFQVLNAYCIEFWSAIPL